MIPLLTYRDKREIADRYQAGCSMPALAESYAVAVNVIQRALQQLGVPRRSPTEARALWDEKNAADGLSRCRECGAGCHPNAVRDLCPACAKRFCERCDTPLSHGSAVKTRCCPDCKFAQRYKDRGPRLCRICGRMGARGTKRDLCGVHIGWFCKSCDQPIPPTRVNKRCPLCEREHKLRLWARQDRVCCQCGEREARNHSSRCAHCQHEDYEVRRWAYQHLDRPCGECGSTLPRGRGIPRCVVCQRKRVRQQRKERQALGAHRCAMCHDPLSLKQDTYCSGCHTMLANWRAAWHAGNEVARMLGTVQTQKRWQAKGDACRG